MAKSIIKKRKDDAPEVRRVLPPTTEQTEGSAAAFKALGDPTRLRIVLFLRAAANLEEPGATQEDLEGDEPALPGGITVGEIASHLTGSDKVTSNVSHHLKELRHAGLIVMKRRGKNILCRLDDEALLALCRLLAESGK